MNSLTPYQCQHDSSEKCQATIIQMQTEWKEKNVLLILPENYSPLEACKQICKQSLFSGMIIVNPGNPEQTKINFKLLDRETPIQVIKANLCDYLNLKISEVALALFPTSVELKADDDLLNTLNLEGIGGEKIYLRKK